MQDGSRDVGLASRYPLDMLAFRSRAQVVLVKHGATPYDASVTLRVWNRYL